MRVTTILLMFIFIGTSSSIMADETSTTFKSPEINAEFKKLPELAATLKALTEARMRVARGELIEKLKAYQTKATQDGDLDEALKVRETIAELERLQAADEKPSNKNVSSKPAKVNIPKDAARFGKSRYYVVTEPKSSAEAEKICAEQGGHLARIETAEEHAFCAKLIQAYRPAKKNDQWIWIDGNDEALEGTFVFGNGELVQYFQWDAMKPNSKKGFNWLTLDVTTGLFHDADAQLRPFLCEWDVMDKSK